MANAQTRDRQRWAYAQTRKTQHGPFGANAQTDEGKTAMDFRA